MFDTNVVVSALLFGGRLGWLPAAWTGRRLIPIVCRETVIELLRVFDKPKFRLDRSDRDAILADYLRSAETFSLPMPLAPPPAACRDRDDEVFIHLAIAAAADALIAGDNDLLPLRGTIPVRILTTGELQIETEKPKNFTNGPKG